MTEPIKETSPNMETGNGIDPKETPRQIEQTSGIRSFLKSDMERSGVEFSEAKVDKVLKAYNYDYDNIIADAGKRAKVKDPEKFKSGIYSHFNIIKPDEENLAEISFLQKPLGDGEGYDRYASLTEDLQLAEAMSSRLKQPEQAVDFMKDLEAVQSTTAMPAPGELELGDESLRPQDKQARIQEEYKQKRILDLQTKIDEINDAIAVQAKSNKKELGYTSREHEEIGNKFDSYDVLLKNAAYDLQDSYKTALGEYHTGTGSLKGFELKEERAKVKNLEDIRSMYSKMGKILGAPQGDNFKEQMNGLLYGFGNNFFTKDFATLGLNEMSRLLNVKEAFDTYKGFQEEGKTDTEISELMPTEQKAMLDTYQQLLEIQAGTKANFGTGIGEGLKEMIPFIAQFAATGGTGATAKKLVKEFIEAKTKSAVAGKIAGTIAKPMVQGALMLPANLQNYAERVAPTMDEQGQLIEGQQPLNAGFKAYLTTMAEVAGEDFGSFANKIANKKARANFAKMISNNPNKAQEFLGKMSLALTQETGVPSVQGFVFEGIGEEATGILQAAIDQDGSFFTPEAQAQLWVMSLMASGGFASASIPNRVATKLRYNQSTKGLKDIPNQDYTDAVQSLTENYDNGEDLLYAFDDVSKEFGVSEQDYYKARNFIGSTIQYNQMSTARAVQLETKIAQYKGSDGNVTMTTYDGQSYAVRNPQDLGVGNENKIVYLKGQDGSVKPIISSKITEYETKNPNQIVDEQISQQDMQDEMFEQAEQMQEEAAERGLIEGNTVNTPDGKKTLVSINPDGTATVIDKKGEESSANLNEIEAYKTQEQKDAEKVEEEADLAIMEGIEEGVEVVADEPLTDGSDVRVIDFSNGQSKIITPEGEQVLNTPEERDTAIKELLTGEIEATQDNIDEMPPEQAFGLMLKEDPDIATEIFTAEINDIRKLAEEKRAAVAETKSRERKKSLLTEAKQLEIEAQRLDAILADPSVLEQQVEEEVAPEPSKIQVKALADELSTEYKQEEDLTPYNQLLPWQQQLLGYQFSKDSFLRWADEKTLSQTIARAWIAKKDSKANDIDTMAQELSELGIEVSPQDIVDFVMDNPSGSVRKTTDRMNEIAKEYRTLTGESIKKHQTPESKAEQVDDIEGSPLGEAPDDIAFRTEEVNVSANARKSNKFRNRAIDELNKLQAKFGVPIEVIHSSDLSTEAQEKAIRTGNVPKAYYQNGTAYILIDTIEGVADAKASYMHEAMLHKGLDLLFDAGPVKILGKTFEANRIIKKGETYKGEVLKKDLKITPGKEALLDEVYDRLDDKTRNERAEIYFKRIPTDQLTEAQRQELAEEVLATINETDSPLVQTLIDKLYNWIKKITGFTSKQFTRADLRNLLRDHNKLVTQQKDVQKEVAPEVGEEVKLRAEPAGQINSDQFKQWFGNSEVVDSKGDPLVVYHGTNADFSSFDPKKQTTTAHGYGFYFATDKDIAKGYRQEGKGRLIEAYLAINKPLEDTSPNFSKEELESVISEMLDIELENYKDEMESWQDSFLSNMVDTYSVSREDAISEVADGIFDYNETAIDQIAELSNIIGDRQTTQQAVKNTLGYDGIFVKDFQETDGDVYIAWFPNQVKSATENTGEFNVSNDDIRFRVAESPQELTDFVKDSKVKETVYHGTASVFDNFKLSKAKDEEGMRRGLGWGKDKFYFTNTKMSAQVAADYAKIQGKGKTPNVMSVRLNITNPINADDYSSKLRQYEESEGSRIKAVERLDSELKTEGIDGIIDDISGGISVFKPSQILIEPKEDVKFRVESPTVYHGSDQVIDNFDISKAKGSGKASRNKAGIFFTSDPSFAKSWGENLNERKLELNKPLTTDSSDPIISEVFGEDGFSGNIKAITNKKADKLKEAGFDGVIGFERWTDWESGERRRSDVYLMFNEEGIVKPTEEKIEVEREQVNTNPSEAQKEAGNYKMGHIQFDGFNVSIENPKGSIRSGKDADGKRWSNIMPADYGYFKNTVGNDKDHIDVFMGDNMDSDKVYVVDQINEDGSFDEHKVMMGYNSISEARNAYNEAYDEGWQGLGNITRTTKEGLKEWFKGDTKKPFAPMDEVKFRVQSQDPEVQKMLDKLQAMQKVTKTSKAVQAMEEGLPDVFPEMRQTVLDQIAAYKAGSKTGAEDAAESIKNVQTELIKYAKKVLPMTEAGGREIGRILTVIRNSQTIGSLEAAVNEIDVISGVSESKKELKKNTSKVNRLLKWMTGLKKQGAQKVGKFNYADTKEFQELKAINDEAIRLVKQSNSYKSTAEQKMEAEKALDEMWDSLNDKEVKTDLDNAMMKLIELRRLGTKASPALAQIVSEELEAIYTLAKDAKNEADMNKSISIKNDRELVKEFLRDDFIKDKKFHEKADRVMNNITADIMGNWETVMTMIGGYELRDKMSLLVEEANMSVGKSEMTNSILDKAKELYGIKTKAATLTAIHDLSKEDYELRRPNRHGEKGEGAPMKLSKLHLMDIYNAIKNEDIKRDYYMSYGDIAIDEKGKRDIKTQIIDGEARINELLDNLLPEDMQFADAMQSELDTYYDKVNKIHIKLFNRDLPRVENYWPSTAERTKDIDPMEQYSADHRYASGFNERAARRTPIPGDAFNKFNKHVDEMEWMANMALPHKAANDIFKDNNVRSLLESARGKKFPKLVDELLSNTTLNAPAKVQQKTALNKLFDPLLNNWVTSKIGLTPTVPIKQLLSTVNYSENMPTAKWLKGFMEAAMPQNWAKTWDEMMKIPYLKARLGSGYSEAIQRALNSDENTHKSKAANYHQAFKNMTTAGTRYGDIVAIMFGGKPYLDYLIEEGMKKDGAVRSEVEKEAVDKFLEDTLRSQQSPFSSSLSKFQNSKNVLARAIFAFANTPSQYMRKLFEANQNLRVVTQQHDKGNATKEDVNKARKQFRKAHQIYGVVNTVSFTMVGLLLSSAMKGTDIGDDWWKDVLFQLEQTYIGGIPVIKDLIIGNATKAVLGMKIYDASKPIVEGIDQVVTAGIKLASGDAKNPEKEYKNVAQGVSTMLGVPLYNIEKTVKSFSSEYRDENRAKQANDKLNELKKSDKSSEANAANEIKKAYSKAKATSTRLKKDGKVRQAKAIEDAIAKSKVNLWDTDYSTSDMMREQKKFELKVNNLK